MNEHVSERERSLPTDHVQCSKHNEQEHMWCVRHTHATQEHNMDHDIFQKSLVAPVETTHQYATRQVDVD